MARFRRILSVLKYRILLLQLLIYAFYNCPARMSGRDSSIMNELKVIKIVNKGKTYLDKKGKEHCQINYYLVINNTWVPIRPSFSKGYTQLDLVAERRVNGGASEDEH